jgi:hypothetical protein
MCADFIGRYLFVLRKFGQAIEGKWIGHVLDFRDDGGCSTSRQIVSGMVVIIEVVLSVTTLAMVSELPVSTEQARGDDDSSSWREYPLYQETGHVVSNCLLDRGCCSRCFVARITVDLITRISGSFVSSLTSTFIQRVTLRMVDWVAAHFMCHHVLYRWFVSASAV